MSDTRIKCSGAEFRKRAKAKKENFQNVLAKTPKLDTFVVKLSSASAVGESADAVVAPPSTDSVADMSVSDVRAQLDESNTEATHETEISITPVDSDPAMWKTNDATRDYVAKHGIPEIDINGDFSNSTRLYGEKARVLTPFLLVRTLKNGEKQIRSHLCYSKSTGKLLCVPCMLFEGKSQLATDGFNDWKNGTMRLNEHENSLEHKSCLMTLKARGHALASVATGLTRQLNEEVTYWRNVLKRVVAVVRKLASRGLAFRGQDDRFGSVHNGNYIMGLELVAEFDPFLAEHISKYGNTGKGSTSYLSAFTCEQFIHMMADLVLQEIIYEIKTSKYFSISVDSTPDIAHVDQLSFVIRYVKDDGTPVERFLFFIPNSGHGAEQIASVVFETLERHNLNISDCRGQSYDNASNMSGQYSGLQARIKAKNPLAVYIPCSAHSLNLIGTCAAECCTEACAFFDFLQSIFVFFSASTHRWETLEKYLSKREQTLSLKKLSTTRWSAREDACRSLNRDWEEITKALTEIEGDLREKPVTRNEASGILHKMDRLETAIMSTVWGTILSRFNAVSKQLQSVSIDLGLVVELYGSLIEFIKESRDMYDHYEYLAIEKSTSKTYETKRKRTLMFSDGQTQQAAQGREAFRCNTFVVILDKLRAELTKRQEAYLAFNSKFAFLFELPQLQPGDVTHKARQLVATYDADLEPDLVEECLHFRAHLVHVSTQHRSLLDMYKDFRLKGLENVYPNLDIALRIFLCTPATNCTTERSFSALKRVKNYLRSRMGEVRLNDLSILTIESDVTISLDYDCIIDKFALQSRRKALV